MTSYNSIDGIPCTSNHYLLTKLLRNEWKFRGFVVSDLYSIEGIHESHFVAPTKENAAIQSVMAGVDVDLGMLIPTFVMQFNPDKWIRL